MASDAHPRPPEPSTDDGDLVRRYQQGDTHACRELLLRHQDRLYRLAGVWLFDASEAEDVVQEVFARALKGLLRFRFRSAPFTWFYTTCRNVCREHNRRRRAETYEERPGDPAFEPQQRAQLHDVQKRAQRLMETLTERQREVVMLRVFEEFSVRDTAKIMGCREGTVKALLHKAMAAMRREAGE
jgi:RNA polymerase sigma-70 factor (ECF subfamily)